jgi:hypothetical protein
MRTLPFLFVFSVSYSCFYPINIPLSNRLDVRMKQFDNCKNILTNFGDWESDISQQIRINVGYNWKKVQNILFEVIPTSVCLSFRFCTNL